MSKVLLGVCILLAFVLAGCSSKRETIVTNPPPVNEVELKENVTILGESARAAITDVEEDYIVTDQTLRVTSGEILVSDEAPIFLRKVVSAQQIDVNQQKIITEDASLEDVIAKGRIEFSVPLEYEPSLQTHADLESQGFEYKNGEFCIDTKDETSPHVSTLFLEGCIALDLRIEIDADFNVAQPDKTEVKIFLTGGVTAEVAPKIIWEFIEQNIQFEFEYAIGVLASSPEISTPLGAIRIPIEVGPVIAFAFVGSITEKVTEGGGVEVSLFTINLEANLGEVGVKTKGNKIEPHNAGFTSQLSLEPTQVRLLRGSHDALDSFEGVFRLGPQFHIRGFGQANFIASAGFYIDVNPEIKWSNLKPERIDYAPEFGVRALIEGDINLGIWKRNLFRSNVSLTLFQQVIWKQCGSFPLGGSVSLTPEKVSMNSNESQLFKASIEGFPYYLGSCDKEINWLIDEKMVPNYTELAYTYQATNTGSFKLTAQNKAKSEEFATANITVTNPNTYTHLIEATVTSLPEGNWQATLIYPNLSPSITRISQVGNAVPVDANGEFTLPLSSPPPPPAQLIPVNSSLPASVVVEPGGTLGVQLSLVVFDDVNGDGFFGSGERVVVLNDPVNDFNPQLGLRLVFADRAFRVSGNSETSAGSPVRWDVDASKGWGRFTETLIENDTAVKVAYEVHLSGLQLEPGLVLTIQSLDAFSEPHVDRVPLLFGED